MMTSVDFKHKALTFVFVLTPHGYDILGPTAKYRGWAPTLDACVGFACDYLDA